ncbi:hypothetical protein OHS33_34385 [Streptomyces sp. NBC_00536]|uniref:hypothetical protein n=1 Tax=Streptomyces sp. NBC_00536 TaxID=2975769 RepID=UPI002E7FE9FF|nr:hypothetical protein [Streptomyces sp. NBC_00536]WUC83011.1 hypothetical protein OHS33_34385 [Streptomyces sp. NBC_00536]
MLFVFLFFIVFGFIVVAAPGFALGYAFVVTSSRLSLLARLPMLVALAVGSGLAWRQMVGDANFWRPAIIALSFLATLTSGAIFLAREARARRARRAPVYPGPVWPAWSPPTEPQRPTHTDQQGRGA